MSKQFHKLSVLGTEDHLGGLAKSILFDVPAPLREVFSWRAGQHLSIRFYLDGQELRRSYSISSSPATGDPMRITVKRIKAGVVSNHINDHCTMGDTIDVMPPFGSFCLDTEKNERRTHYFFGAGSGITPLYSMLNSVLCDEPHSVVHLLYGNRNAKNILFKEELANLVKNNPKRISVSHVLSSPPLFGTFYYWQKGIINDSAIKSFISENPPYAQNARYYICGPAGMNQTVESALTNMDVPHSRIHMESYGGAIGVEDSVKGVAATALVELQGKTHEVDIKEDQTILEAALESGLNPPFSCQSGVCAACKATCTEGSVHMRHSMALEKSEIERGEILACQSVASTSQLKIRFEPHV